VLANRSRVPFISFVSVLQRERESNRARQERLHGYEHKREQDEEAFGDWTATKEALDGARQCLGLLSVTLLASAEGSNALATDQGIETVAQIKHKLTSGGASRRNGPLLDRAPADDEVELWDVVGYCCRAIDRTLLGMFSSYGCSPQCF
jgi:hypothetical protein